MGCSPFPMWWRLCSNPRLWGPNRTRSLISALKQYGTQAIISTFESSLTLWAFAEIYDPSLTHGLGTLSWFKHPLFEDLIKYNGQSIQLKPNPPKDLWRIASKRSIETPLSIGRQSNTNTECHCDPNGAPKNDPGRDGSADGSPDRGSFH